MYEYRGAVTRVVDGDTVDVDVDLGLHTHRVCRIRLLGINAPEIRGEDYADGVASREALERFLDGYHRVVIVRTKKDRKGRYGRWLGEIFVGDELQSVNDWLVTHGFAREVRY